jgi:ABC-type sulfate/molybdate transport systems ATPase subunit
MLKVNITSFSYAEKEILKNINFQLQKGEHFSILGESGCGKSTLLHIIYGLLHINQGTLSWGEKPLLGPKFNLVPGEEFMKLVAQEYNVMPYTSVAENVATYLSRLDEKADQERIHELLEVVEMEDFSTTKVKHLSGGQKQRVALAKALAKQPQLLLLDEPFSHIDNFRKNKLRRKLFNYLKSNQIACITATHDAEEALAFSDRILILNKGTIELMGTPEVVFNNLVTGFQAGFFGDVSVIPKGVFSSSEQYLLPHQLILSPVQSSLQVVVEECYFKGSHYLIQCRFKEEFLVYFNYSSLLNKGETHSLVLLTNKP